LEKDAAGKRRGIIQPKEPAVAGSERKRNADRRTGEAAGNSALRAGILKKKVQTVIRERSRLVEPEVKEISIVRQCEILGISSASYYYKKQDNRAIKKMFVLGWIYEVLIDYPSYGYRKVYHLLKEIIDATEKQVRRIMFQYKLRAVFGKIRTTISEWEHRKYPYLLRGKKIEYPNQVWATDITYIKIGGQTVYLCAILDLYSRKVLSWRLSINMETSFCVSALEEALAKYGTPAIFNSDQGSQFTSREFIDILEGKGIRVSMDGKGRALDNIYVERFWRSVKYEDIKYRHYLTMEELRKGLGRYIADYNGFRPHQSLDYKTPDEFYYKPFSAALEEEKTAA